jgi:hypothetical protein
MVIPFSAIPLFAQTFSDGKISISNPIVMTPDSSILWEVKRDSQVILSVEVRNDGLQNVPYTAIVEVRDKDGITIYLQYQKSVAKQSSSDEIGISWIPNESGDYVIRSFLLSDLDNPIVLSPIMQSEIKVGERNVIIESISHDEEDENPYVHPESRATYEELTRYALELINVDRAKYHLPPVKLSDNIAAGFHADDVFILKHISHWLSDGEKPYMTYSKFGGKGNVGQNIAVSGDLGYHQACSTPFFDCETIDPYEEIRSHQYAMMYEDEECCDNGHRDNILDPYHTHVSIGINYDDHFFVMVQNFENQYITWTDEIRDNNDLNNPSDVPDIDMAGYFDRNTDGLSSNDLSLSAIGIYYDPIPTADTYQENRDKGSYDSGILVASVVEPLREKWYYEEPTDYMLIIATEWKVYNDDFEIAFSLDSLREKHGDGVYTTVIWCEDENEDAFVVAGISTFLY